MSELQNRIMASLDDLWTVSRVNGVATYSRSADGAPLPSSVRDWARVVMLQARSADVASFQMQEAAVA